MASALGGAGTPFTRLYESADAARDQQVSFLPLKRLELMLNPGQDPTSLAFCSSTVFSLLLAVGPLTPHLSALFLIKFTILMCPLCLL